MRGNFKDGGPLGKVLQSGDPNVIVLLDITNRIAGGTWGGVGHHAAQQRTWRGPCSSMPKCGI